MSETVHATAILVGANGVLIRGPSGSGKSFLALTLIAEGARLVADDRVHLSVCHGRVVATALGAVRGLIELRGRGPVPVAAERSAVVRLVVDLVEGEAPERMPDSCELSTSLAGVRLARQPVAARSGAGALLVEAALRALSPQRDTGLHDAGVWRRWRPFS